MITFEHYQREFSKLLTEGGSAGHMAHPFDLPDVNKGVDIVSIMKKAWTSLNQTPGAVKIDGVNVSFKMINQDGKRQFAVDRGSMKPIDVEGITIDRIGERFPEGHGMREACTKLLTIFNKSIPFIEDELKELGIYSNSKLFFNTEYVEQKTNVTQYNSNFLAIHGINQFFQVTPKRRASKEVPYSKKTLDKLAEKVNIIARQYNFVVHTSVPTQVSGQPNFQEELMRKYTINYSDTESETKTLDQWLQQVTNPRDTKIKMGERTVGALSKQVYMYVINGNHLNEIFDPEDYPLAISGAIFYHATMVLGQVILNNLTSIMGDLTSHEGVVIRDPKISSKPFKITGNFIVAGMQSGFQK